MHQRRMPSRPSPCPVTTPPPRRTSTPFAHITDYRYSRWIVAATPASRSTRRVDEDLAAAPRRDAGVAATGKSAALSPRPEDGEVEQLDGMNDADVLPARLGFGGNLHRAADISRRARRRARRRDVVQL